MKPGDVIPLPSYDLPAEAMPQVFERDGARFEVMMAWKFYTVESGAVIEKVNIMIGERIK